MPKSDKSGNYAGIQGQGLDYKSPASQEMHQLTPTYPPTAFFNPRYVPLDPSAPYLHPSWDPYLPASANRLRVSQYEQQHQGQMQNTAEGAPNCIMKAMAEAAPAPMIAPGVDSAHPSDHWPVGSNNQGRQKCQSHQRRREGEGPKLGLSIDQMGAPLLQNNMGVALLPTPMMEQCHSYQI
jgi:hypothetical protein